MQNQKFKQEIITLKTQKITNCQLQKIFDSNQICFIFFSKNSNLKKQKNILDVKVYYFKYKQNLLYQLMGISRDSRHKRRLTGGRMPIHKKKRAFEKGRQAAMTKLISGEKRVRRIRVRGGNFKFRALRLSEGNFSWASQGIAKKAKIVEVHQYPLLMKSIR
ncbi:unnamed protein product [Paramecium sonneborni]|uniref:40S ribosomal protein S8 n=1 Tax=Paramecium sonneborni TaxID=65129 RepID=A0A8S1LHE9_9CILI|nr:unnamed protein product [Paramecium sonneborni]